MSFYAHPFQRRQAPASHAAHFPFATAPGVTTSPSFNFFTAPHSPAPAPAPASTPDYAFYDTIDAEEQAALAHLRSIQQRREAAQAAARREAALQAHLAARQEAAYAAAVERHLIEQKQKQQQQDAAARAIAFEQHRRAQIAAAQREIVQREVARRELAQREFARRAYAIEQRKAAEEEWIKKRNACARRCAGGCANVKKAEEKPKEEEKEEHDEWKEMNEVLASLFGFNFAQPQEARKEEKAPAPVAKPEVKAEHKPVDKVEQPAPAAPKSADAKPASPKPESADAPKPAQLDLNDLLSTFLGMSLEPAKADDKPSENANQLTAKLNDFLGQFGLEFESIDSVEKSTKAESSSAAAAKSGPAPTPAKADAPAPASTSAPAPADKGKSVAEGEKPARPTETTAAFNKLRDISHELHLATESFTFPSKLSFADTASSDATPALLFNKGNSGYHAQAHKLLQLLLAADGISSGGDREVRKQRKAIVKAIEGAIEQLETKRDEVWREVKEKREMGAEVSDDESVSSWNSTEVEHVEHAKEQERDDEVKEKTEEPTEKPIHAEAAAVESEEKPAEQAEVKVEDTEVKGFEVPAEENRASETTSKATPETETKEVKGGKKQKANEDEFELL